MGKTTVFWPSAEVLPEKNSSLFIRSKISTCAWIGAFVSSSITEIWIYELAWGLLDSGRINEKRSKFFALKCFGL